MRYSVTADVAGVGKVVLEHSNLCPVWFGSGKSRGLHKRDAVDVRQEVLGLGEKSA